MKSSTPGIGSAVTPRRRRPAGVALRRAAASGRPCVAARASSISPRWPRGQSRYVGAGVHAHGEHRRAGGGVEGRGFSMAAIISVSLSKPFLKRWRDADAEPLGEHARRRPARRRCRRSLGGGRGRTARLVLGLSSMECPLASSAPVSGDLGCRAGVLGQRLKCRHRRPGDDVHRVSGIGADRVDAAQALQAAICARTQDGVDDGLKKSTVCTRPRSSLPRRRRHRRRGRATGELPGRARPQSTKVAGDTDPAWSFNRSWLVLCSRHLVGHGASLPHHERRDAYLSGSVPRLVCRVDGVVVAAARQIAAESEEMTPVAGDEPEREGPARGVVGVPDDETSRSPWA